MVGHRKDSGPPPQSEATATVQPWVRSNGKVASTLAQLGRTLSRCSPQLLSLHNLQPSTLRNSRTAPNSHRPPSSSAHAVALSCCVILYLPGAHVPPACAAVPWHPCICAPLLPLYPCALCPSLSTPLVCPSMYPCPCTPAPPVLLFVPHACTCPAALW